METLPEELIVDILLRLPVKSLLRFKSIYMEFVYLGTLGRCLNPSIVDENINGAEIWLMKEYGMKSSWTKSMVVIVEIPCEFFFPICLTKRGEIVGSVLGYDKLLKCNDKGKVLENYEYKNQPYEDNAIACRESLRSLHSESEEGGGDNQQQ
ncbi:uncharacterized protein LOC129292853 [Prosopis cineraria]|uniref:uncharacterized protein LOC129292853 n=1 Tax=Prosopis cineraria TaxID=364024 RepID=UPI00240F0782|nr:uncharacterized protein LOC129292853 [Prosopis cineraria]